MTEDRNKTSKAVQPMPWLEAFGFVCAGIAIALFVMNTGFKTWAALLLTAWILVGALAVVLLKYTGSNRRFADERGVRVPGA